MYAGVISSVEMLSRSFGCVGDPVGADGSNGRSSPASCRCNRDGSSVSNSTRPLNRTRSGTLCTLRVRRLSIMRGKMRVAGRDHKRCAWRTQRGPAGTAGPRWRADAEQGSVRKIAATFALVMMQILAVSAQVAAISAQIARIAALIPSIASKLAAVLSCLAIVSCGAIVPQLSPIRTPIAVVGPDVALVAADVATVAS